MRAVALFLLALLPGGLGLLGLWALWERHCRVVRGRSPEAPAGARGPFLFLRTVGRLREESVRYVEPSTLTFTGEDPR